MNTTKLLLAATFCSILTHATFAEVKTREIEYKQGDQVLQGFLAYDNAVKGKRPGVLVVHEWWGHNAHARKQAMRLAEAGYAGFALDMYGKGKVATHPKDATAFMQEVMKDAALMTARFEAAREVLRQQPEVDPAKIAATGYCFGGTVALKMARSGVDLAAVVTFHAGLQIPGEPPAKGSVKPRILVMTGGADTMIPKEQVDAFEKEMKDAGASVEIVTLAGAKHAFTNPDADKAGIPGLAYNARADKESWERAVKFLKDVFGK